MDKNKAFALRQAAEIYASPDAVHLLGEEVCKENLKAILRRLSDNQSSHKARQALEKVPPIASPSDALREYIEWWLNNRITSTPELALFFEKYEAWCYARNKAKCSLPGCVAVIRRLGHRVFKDERGVNCISFETKTAQREVANEDDELKAAIQVLEAEHTNAPTLPIPRNRTGTCVRLAFDPSRRSNRRR